MIVTTAMAARTTAGGSSSGVMPTAHNDTSSTRNHASFAATAAANASRPWLDRMSFDRARTSRTPCTIPVGGSFRTSLHRWRASQSSPLPNRRARDSERTIAMSPSAATTKIAVPTTASQMTLGSVVCPLTTTPITAIRGRTSADSGSKNAANTMPAVAVSAGISHCR